MTRLRRILALALTMAALSSPLTLALCHVECVDSSAHHDQPAEHSCHGSTDPAAVSMTAVPHMCGHDEQAPAGIERALQNVAAPVAEIAPAVWTPPARVARVVSAVGEPSPPLSFQSISQLRV